MNAAIKIPDLDLIAKSETPASNAAHHVQKVMQEAATSSSFAQLDSLMRFQGPSLIHALNEIAEATRAEDTGTPGLSLEKRLEARGVRQDILDNLEISRLHFRRGVLLLDHLMHMHRPETMPEGARVHIAEAIKARWEHCFGMIFLACIASGLIAADAPGVDPMLVWMRRGSREVSARAFAADEELQSAA